MGVKTLDAMTADGGIYRRQEIYSRVRGTCQRHQTVHSGSNVR
jgi:hypothetical protein